MMRQPPRATTAATRARIAPFRRARFEQRGRLTQSRDEHEPIVAALLAGDGALASERMRAHVNAVRAASADYVRSLPPSDGSEKPPQRAFM